MDAKFKKVEESSSRLTLKIDTIETDITEIEDLKAKLSTIQDQQTTNHLGDSLTSLTILELNESSLRKKNLMTTASENNTTNGGRYAKLSKTFCYPEENKQANAEFIGLTHQGRSHKVAEPRIQKDEGTDRGEEEKWGEKSEDNLVTRTTKDSDYETIAGKDYKEKTL